jgi:hypothetical protein
MQVGHLTGQTSYILEAAFCAEKVASKSYATPFMLSSLVNLKQLCWSDPAITPWVVSAKAGQWAMGAPEAMLLSAPGGGHAALDAGCGPL